MRDLVLGVDQGTTSTRAGVMDRGGRMRSLVQVPHRQSYPREGRLGMGRGSDRADLARAALEGIACRVAQVVRAMEQDAGLAIDALRVDGGLTGCAALMQMQADLLGVPVEVADAEATLRGVCFLGAGLSAGRRAVVVGAEHVSYSAAHTLTASGTQVVAMVTALPRHQTYGVLAWLAAGRHRIPLLTDSEIARISGKGRVDGVGLVHRPTGVTRSIACDTVVLPATGYRNTSWRARSGRTWR